mgnify:CR=1 FL=1
MPPTGRRLQQPEDAVPLAEAVKLLEGEKGRKDSANKDLKSEITRIKALLKKAVPFDKWVSLADHSDEYASNLPYGLQRRLEIDRALATEYDQVRLAQIFIERSQASTDDSVCIVSSIAPVCVNEGAEPPRSATPAPGPSL